jgi:hypothetical protein
MSSKLLVCPNCGASNLITDRFCVKCGSQTTQKTELSPGSLGIDADELINNLTQPGNPSMQANITDPFSPPMQANDPDPNSPPMQGNIPFQNNSMTQDYTDADTRNNSYWLVQSLKVLAKFLLGIGIIAGIILIIAASNINENSRNAVEAIPVDTLVWAIPGVVLNGIISYYFFLWLAHTLETLLRIENKVMKDFAIAILSNQDALQKIEKKISGNVNP